MMPMLKSLSVGCFKGNAHLWKQFFNALSSSSNLKELTLGCKEELEIEAHERLASFLSTNSTVRVFNIKHSSQWFSPVPPTQWVDLFGRLQSSTLEELRLSGLTVTNSILKAISQYMSINQALKVLEIPDCKGIRNETWVQFTSVLQSHKCIEEINILWEGSGSESDSDDAHEEQDENTIQLLAVAIEENSSLRRIRIPITGVAELETIASTLTTPNCTLEELIICTQIFKKEDLILPHFCGISTQNS